MKITLYPGRSLSRFSMITRDMTDQNYDMEDIVIRIIEFILANGCQPIGISRTSDYQNSNVDPTLFFEADAFDYISDVEIMKHACLQLYVGICNAIYQLDGTIDLEDYELVDLQLISGPDTYMFEQVDITIKLISRTTSARPRAFLKGLEDLSGGKLPRH